MSSDIVGCCDTIENGMAGTHGKRRIEAPITQGKFTPFKGWRFIVDQNGAIHHVPDMPLIHEMCKLYYGVNYDK